MMPHVSPVESVQNGTRSADQAGARKDSVMKQSHGEEPYARRWDHLFSLEATARMPSIFQAMHGTLAQANILSLGPGAPLPQYFPFDHVSAQVPAANHDGSDESVAEQVTIGTNKNDMRDGKSCYDLSSALNYGLGTGARQLVSFVTEHTKMIHNPPYKDWKCIMTGGNTSALDLAFRTFTDRGSYVLADKYTYATAFECAAPLGVKLLGVKLDEEGPVPSELEHLLDTWDQSHVGSKKPHLLYTVPTGHNPTGATQSLKRRHEIYKIAQEHDLYILEDDPYYFIQMPPYVAKDISQVANSVPALEPKMFSLIPSLLSMDTDGRVFRMDSFSKIIAPGLRTGWLTASEQVIERLVRAHETSLQNPSGFSQIMLFKLLSEQWGHEGLMHWLGHLRTEYTMRRDNLLTACETYLPGEIVEWKVPRAGFFTWIKINWSVHPNAKKYGPREIETQIYDATIKAGTLVVPGSWFQPDRTMILPEICFRVTFASLSPEDMAEATKRFGEALRFCFQLQPEKAE